MNENIIGRGWAFAPRIGAHGGILLTNHENEIGQAIRIILTTALGERVMRPLFGSRLHELVFAPINLETLALAKRYVEDALNLWEPRINLIDVNVSADHAQHNHGCLLISMQYEIKSTHDRRTLVYPFYLIPGE